MLKNFFKIAFRNLTKQKGYALINILGLSVGIGVFLFLFLLDQYALTFDSYHEKSEQIYRLADQVKTRSGSIVDAAITPAPWGKAIEEEYPQVEESVRFRGQSAVVAHDEKILPYGVTYVDESVFRVFTYPFKLGDPETAFSNPQSVVLTAEEAGVFFGDENPIGKTLLINKEPHEVTGVLKKLHDQSSFEFNMLIPFSSLTESTYSGLNDWESHNLYTYFLLREGADPDKLEAGLQDFIVKQFGEEGSEKYQPHLQPLESIFLGSDLFAEHGATLEPMYIYIFSAIAFLILLIACINFINMATARGMERAREVGMRKVLGAGRAQLVIQFLSEALILAALATLVSMQLVEMSLPWFNDLTEWNVQVNYFSNIPYSISIIGVILLVGVMAGGYPAFYLSSFRPSPVLKGDRISGSGGSLLRTSLVVAQFAVGIFLIISSGVVDNQLDFLKNKDLGFDTENIMVSSVPKNGDRQTIRQELSRKASVSAISFSSSVPGEGGGDVRTYRPEGQFSEDGLLITYYSVDDNFLNFYGIDLMEGRNFNREIASDTSSAILINEAAARKFGWSEPIGKEILAGSDGDEQSQRRTVVGMVEDFHHETLHNKIRPLILEYNPEELGLMSAKLNTTSLSETAEEISAFLKNFNSGLPVSHRFLAQDIADEYTTEEVIGQMLRYFTYLTLFIACLGLLGLASYTIVQRKKEIGVRKVLGATITEIIGLLSKKFMTLIVIGFVIGAPLAYLLLSQWLQSFAYQTGMSPLLFAGAGIITVVIAGATISYHAIQAARMNPVESLRSE